MTLAVTYSRALIGVDAPLVTVEVHLSGGLPGMSIVGLPETAVRESRDRVRSALINAHFDMPAMRITINLAPADLPKEGGRYDLPIALGILAASGQIPMDKLAQYEFLGELSLAGELRSVSAVLPAAIAAHAAGRILVVPLANGDEAALPGDCTVLAPDHLLALCAHLHGREILPDHHAQLQPEPVDYPDMADVKGQPQARRALEIAASGEHNLLYVGSPGAGKTMLAKRLPGLLPELDGVDALEVAAVHSIGGQWQSSRWRQRPFRDPHHTASPVAMVGGGSRPRPGEVSLAHGGVLFLDELPEFQRQVLEVLRQPLESGEIVIARAAQKLRFPARFQLVAAMNPCPCGYLDDKQRACRCSPEQVHRYQAKISGPLLDRIDMHVPVQPVVAHVLLNAPAEESSAIIRQRVIATRQRQLVKRGVLNSQLAGHDLDAACGLSTEDRQFLEATLQKLHFSARAFHRILRLARTIADMAEQEHVSREALAEAISYRYLDRERSVGG